MYIAILGYGVVGSGVYQAVLRNQERIARQAGPVMVKRILDLRDFPGDQAEPLLTKDFTVIANDPEIGVVAEAMGGVNPAFSFARACLEKGKSYVTSNKELVAAHGAELMAIAREQKVSFLFEASVCGGIPLIKPLHEILMLDELTEITGIVNGTTNYILTAMAAQSRSFDETLAEAQRLGYAERNPAADINGFDAARKLAILLSLISGKVVRYETIPTEGITGLSAADFAYAARLGGSVKLLARGILGEQPAGLVAPFLLPASHLLAHVDGVYNAVMTDCRLTGKTLFYGEGAGKLPTATAVVSDIVDAIRHQGKHIPMDWSSEGLELLPAGAWLVKKLVRVDKKDDAERIFGDVEWVEGVAEGECAFVSPEMTEDELVRKMAELAKREAGVKVLGTIRML